MIDVLAAIAAYKRQDVAARKLATSQAEVEARALAAPPVRGFAQAIANSKDLALIAEVKKASPSKGLIRADFDPPALARAYAEGGATCLSVLTDAPSFQGADTHLFAARTAVDLPVLRKDFIVDPWQVAESRALGADAVLIILAMVDDALAAELLAEAARFDMDALVEIHDEGEMARAAGLQARLIGVNNRDLRTFATDLATFDRLAHLRPLDSLLVAESGISEPTDAARVARSGAAAMLVGESLMRRSDVAEATRNLLAGAKDQRFSYPTKASQAC